MGKFQEKQTLKMGYFKKKHVINFKTGKALKVNTGGFLKRPKNFVK